METIALNRKAERKWHVERRSPLADFLEERLVISTQKCIYLPRIRDILYLRSENNYCRIYLTDSKEILASKTLKHMGELLESKGFLRIHASFLVNLNKITAISKKGNLFFELDEDQKVPISAKYRTAILDVIRRANKV
jgi:two-component system LytT family response regulator